MVDSQNGRLSCMAPSATPLLVVASFLYWLKLAVKCIGGHIQRETMWKKRGKKTPSSPHYSIRLGAVSLIFRSLFLGGGYSLGNWCEGTQSFKRIRKIIGQKDVWSYCIILWHFSLRLNSCTVLSKRETLSLSHLTSPWATYWSSFCNSLAPFVFFQLILSWSKAKCKISLGQTLRALGSTDVHKWR